MNKESEERGPEYSLKKGNMREGSVYKGAYRTICIVLLNSPGFIAIAWKLLCSCENEEVYEHDPMVEARQVVAQVDGDRLKYHILVL